MTNTRSTPAGDHAPRERTVELDVGPVHVREAGASDAPALLFLHGWPQTSLAWDAVMRAAAADGYRAVAPDLPGVGGSRLARTDGSTEALAGVVSELARAVGLDGFTLVGHDLGGMVTYSYLRRPDASATAGVIMDTVVPGVEPWSQVITNPYVWHFAFHSIPELPETVVQGRERPYFDFFFDALSGGASGVTDSARAAYAEAYSTPDALTAGFDWYRMLPRAAEVNAAREGVVRTPVLYLRGEAGGSDTGPYVQGFEESGLDAVRAAVIPGAGHFSPEDAPCAVWSEISSFLRDNGS